ncbi:MAG: hypothetical protein LAT82_02585 [Nanoarchaeota archaeon]|nr:hypothetical protein [Nanoarchaeota archaeon]
MVTQEEVNKHLERLSSTNNMSHFDNLLNAHFNTNEIREIKEYDDLSLSFFEKLKQENHLKFEDRWPHLNPNSNVNFDLVYDKDDLKIKNLSKFGKLDIFLTNKAIENEIEKEDLVIFRQNFYLQLLENSLFLFENIIKSISPKISIVMLGKLYTHIIDDNNYIDYKKLFDGFNKNIRNAIGHGSFRVNIEGEKIDYYYYDWDSNEETKKTITLGEFHKLLVKTIYVYELFLKNIDKVFLSEIKGLYEENGFKVD